MTETRSTYRSETRADYEYEQNGYTTTQETRRDAEPSIGDLFTNLSQNFSTLIRDEIRLAQVEMKQKGKKAMSGIISLAVGGFVAYAGFLVLLAAAVVGLSYYMWTWLAALIVGVVVALIGTVMLVGGLSRLRNIDPAPQQTIETLKEDRDWAKRQVK
ncbi:phage holin family protein [bacterium]|nr:phage holin family protein [bacterium]